MNLRAAIACSLLLSSACGPGPGDTTSTTSTTEGAATGTGTDTTGTGTPTTGGSTGDTTAAPTSTGATSGTSDGPSCEDIVGVKDCQALVAASGELTLETCMKCQGIACGQEPECDQEFPCVDRAIVIQGCCTDAQCEGLSPFCGMFIATNSVCVNSDDI